MNLEKLVAVSGKGGVYKMVGNKQNGLILQDLDAKSRFFASSRIHQITPLDSISIFTMDEDETTSLADVFNRIMHTHDGELPINAKSSSDSLKDFFADILPNYDRHRVMVSDIKKIVKWYQFLHQRNLLELDSQEVGEEE